MTENNRSVKYLLQWRAAPRPPVHPNSMVGTQGFPTAMAASAFFKKLSPDAEFIGLTKVTTTREDVSDLII